MKNNLNEKGRSMIEMLGVLAIIGVLSVGGIAGYSKAMTKYRINKTIEQITLIAGNIQNFYASQSDYTGFMSYNGPYQSFTDDAKKIVKKAKLAPEEMWEIENGKLIKLNNIFGGEVIIYGSNTNISRKNASIIFTNIPTEACIELDTHDWSSIPGIIGFKAGNERGPQFFTQSIPSRYIQAKIDTATSSCSYSSSNYLAIFLAK